MHNLVQGPQQAHQQCLGRLYTNDRLVDKYSVGRRNWRVLPLGKHTPVQTTLMRGASSQISEPCTNSKPQSRDFETSRDLGKWAIFPLVKRTPETGTSPRFSAARGNRIKEQETPARHWSMSWNVNNTDLWLISSVISRPLCKCTEGKRAEVLWEDYRD